MHSNNFRSHLFLSLAIAMALSSCRATNYSMRHPNYRIDFQAEDFTFSKQVSAEATSIRILGVDWKRLFNWSEGSARSDRFSDSYGIQSEPIGFASGASALSPISDGSTLLGTLGIPSIPVIGTRKKGKATAYALYTLMKENPGYDIVIYPQFEQTNFLVPIFYSKRKVKVTARLAKIN